MGRSGRFGTKGLAITYVSSKDDSDILEQVQSRFEVEISELPDQIDVSTYSKTFPLLYLFFCFSSLDLLLSIIFLCLFLPLFSFFAAEDTLIQFVYMHFVCV